MSNPVYYFIEIQIHDVEAMKPYQEKVASTYEKFGGKRIIAGGDVEPIDGKPDGRIVMVRFDNAELAHAWHSSPEYQEIMAIRKEAAASRDFFIEGIL